MAVRNSSTSTNASAHSYLERSSSLPSLSAFTICGWFRVSELGQWSTTLCIDNELTGGGGGYVYIQSETATGNELWFYGDNQGQAGAGFSHQFTTVAVGDVFFSAMVISGRNNCNAYHRKHNELVFTSDLNASMGGTADFTPAGVRVGASVYHVLDQAEEAWRGDYWNIKCWNRALTAQELLIESYYRRVMFPNGLNFHWPLDNINDTYDYGGLGRNPTIVNGTTPLSTSDSGPGMWVPRKQMIITTPAVVSAPARVATRSYQHMLVR